MSLPFSSVVAVSGIVQAPAFNVENQHMLLAIVDDLLPTTTHFLEFTNADTFAKYFGTNNKYYREINKYFNFISKTGLTAQKVIIARWYRENAKAFYRGNKIETAIENLKKVNSGSFKVNLNSEEYEVILDLSAVNSYSDIATLIEEKLRAKTVNPKTKAAENTAFINSTCVFNTITSGFIITNGTEAGAGGTVGDIQKGSTGEDLSVPLGLLNCELSQGTNRETWTEFCDRLYNTNTVGFSYTTLENLSDEDIKDSIEWLQTIRNGQTYNTAVRIVFNINDKSIDALTKLVNDLNGLNFTGYVITYDPHSEYINILDCAICASTNYEVETKNFNFQKANGYTPITNYGSITDYKVGNTNIALVEELNNLKVNYIYSLGAGINEVIYYGRGLMAGSFKTEGTQANEAWLEKQLQISIINTLDTLEKIQLRGELSATIFNGVIDSVLRQGYSNGTIARGGTLSDVDKLSIIQLTNNNSAPAAVENNGYYYQIQPLSQEDVNNRCVRIVLCYLITGEVNEVRIINNIYGN